MRKYIDTEILGRKGLRHGGREREDLQGKARSKILRGDPELMLKHA